MMTVLDLFSGIGGFSLGLERTGGFQTVAFCEIDPFCRRVLAKHWPGVKQYEDVRTLDAARLDADRVGPIDVICGGFPCQDISLAGKGAGLDGERSGLWIEYARLIGELRPGFVIVENVAALLGRGLDRVLGDLAEIGFDAEWHCIPASALGAPHRRDRLWLVANASGERPGEARRLRSVQSSQRPSGSGEAGGDVADVDCVVRNEGRPGSPPQGQEWRNADRGGCRSHVADAYGPRLEVLINGHAGQFPSAIGAHGWSVEPDVGRVAYGVPSRVDRLKALGNAVVPQIPELIGRAILAAEAERAAA